MRVAVLGLGFMGATHVAAWQKVPGVELAGVMSSDERKLSGDLTAIEGNLGNSGERFDFTNIARYRSLPEALADPSTDAVDICLPTDLHASAARAALRAGKHVLVEKPIALTAEEATKVIAEAKAARRILMAGQVLRFVPAYRTLAAELRSAGPVCSAFFRRRCAAPAWSRWLAEPARSGGGVFDLLIHDADFCISLWGMPESVRAAGSEDLSAGIDIIHAELKYPNMGPVIITGGWHHPKAYPFSMEFTVVAQQATFEWPFGAKELGAYRADGELYPIPLPDTDAFASELSYFADCVRAGSEPLLCPPRESAASVALMRAILQSRSEEGKEILCPQIPR